MCSTKPETPPEIAAALLAAEINSTHGVGCASVGFDGSHLRVYWHVDGAPVFEKFMGHGVVVEYVGQIGPTAGRHRGMDN